VLTDVMMPDMDGYALFREIRAVQPDLPVVLMTAYYYDKDHVIKRSKADGLQDVIFKKPINPGRLLELIRSAGGAFPTPVAAAPSLHLTAWRSASIASTRAPATTGRLLSSAGRASRRPICASPLRRRRRAQQHARHRALGLEGAEYAATSRPRPRPTLAFIQQELFDLGSSSPRRPSPSTTA
jgi:hypothetical protein